MKKKKRQKQEKEEPKKIKRNEDVLYHEIFFKILMRYFNKLIPWMNNLEDFRIKEKCIYPLHYMIFTGILLYILKLESLRQWHSLNGTTFIKNLNEFLGVDLKTACHFSTLIYFCERSHPENLEKLLYKMTQKLIRGKVLAKYRLFNKYHLIAIDGTGNLTFKYRHCDKCIVRRASNGEIYYYHPVLEAKIVTYNGLAFSIGSEFIENDKGKKGVLSDKEKQDCELKAAYRLLDKIKKKFPQLNICILGDGLYANQQIMQKCKDYGWQYIVTFKEGSIPNVYKEFESLKNLMPENIKEVETGEKKQTFRWINEIEHEGNYANIIDCEEYDKKKDIRKRFVFITNIFITKSTVDYIANQGGRLRWKIENEGFNMQKNGGYNLEHQFSRNKDDTAMKNFYIFMQIAHIINQLVEKSNLLKPCKDYYFKTIKSLSQRLASELNLVKINFEKIFKYSNYYITLDPG